MMVWEIRALLMVGKEDKYLLCHGRVDIDDYLDANGTYDEECKSIICVYYGSVEEFYNVYMDLETRKQILAEMIFEERSYEGANWKLVSKDSVETELLNMIIQLGYPAN